MSAFAVVLAAHVALAIALFLPAFLLPFALRADRPAGGSPRTVVRGLLVLQGTGGIVVGAGLAVTGVLLIGSLGSRLLEQPWLLVALTIYALNLVLAFAIQRPNVRRLLGSAGAGDDRAWRARAQRQRYVSYAMAGLVGTIGWLMSTKPALW